MVYDIWDDIYGMTYDIWDDIWDDIWVPYYGMEYGMVYGMPYGAGWDDTIHNVDDTFRLFRWAPPLEQSRITAFAFSGGPNLLKNIARGTTDPGYRVYNLSYLSRY